MQTRSSKKAKGRIRETLSDVVVICEISKQSNDIPLVVLDDSDDECVSSSENKGCPTTGSDHHRQNDSNETQKAQVQAQINPGGSTGESQKRPLRNNANNLGVSFRNEQNRQNCGGKSQCVCQGTSNVENSKRKKHQVELVPCKRRSSLTNEANDTTADDTTNTKKKRTRKRKNISLLRDPPAKFLIMSTGLPNGDQGSTSSNYVKGILPLQQTITSPPNGDQENTSSGPGKGFQRLACTITNNDASSESVVDRDYILVVPGTHLDGIASSSSSVKCSCSCTNTGEPRPPLIVEIPQATCSKYTSNIPGRIREAIQLNCDNSVPTPSYSGPTIVDVTCKEANDFPKNYGKDSVSRPLTNRGNSARVPAQHDIPETNGDTRLPLRKKRTPLSLKCIAPTSTVGLSRTIDDGVPHLVSHSPDCVAIFQEGTNQLVIPESPSKSANGSAVSTLPAGEPNGTAEFTIGSSVNPIVLCESGPDKSTGPLVENKMLHPSPSSAVLSTNSQVNLPTLSQSVPSMKVNVSCAKQGACLTVVNHILQPSSSSAVVSTISRPPLPATSQAVVGINADASPVKHYTNSSIVSQALQSSTSSATVSPLPVLSQLGNGVHRLMCSPQMGAAVWSSQQKCGLHISQLNRDVLLPFQLTRNSLDLSQLAKGLIRPLQTSPLMMMGPLPLLNPGGLMALSASKKNLRPIAIDGSNVAFSHGKNMVFSCQGIKICIDYFLKHGHTVVKAFVPQFRRKASPEVKDRHLLELLGNDQQLIVFTPSREVGGNMINCYDDRFILDYAAQTGAVVVSNDNFRDLLKENPAWREVIFYRLLMFTFADDVFMVPQDPLGRTGPKLSQFLCF